MTIRQRLLHYFTATVLLSASLAGAAVAGAPAALAATCPDGWQLEDSGSEAVCQVILRDRSMTSWTVPAGVEEIHFIAVAGGGGGGGGWGNSVNRRYYGGGGGGSGGRYCDVIRGLTPGSSIAVSIGRGGWGGTVGGSGMDTSFNGFTATGGTGGSEATSSGGGFYGSGGSAGGRCGGGQTANGAAGTNNTQNTSPSGYIFSTGYFYVPNTNFPAPEVSRGGFGGGSTGPTTCNLEASPGFGGHGGRGNGTHQGCDGSHGAVIIRTAAITVTTPSAPTISAITAGDRQLSIAFTVSDGGSPLTGLEYSIDGGLNWSLAPGTSSPLVITGLVNGNTYNVQVKATNAQGPGLPSTTTSATPLGTALTPLFGSVTRTVDGFTVPITNYDANYTWSQSAGSIDPVTGVLTVNGLSAGASSIITVTSTRPTYSDGTANVTGQALSAALTPAFGTPTRTADGFTVSITNYDANYTWSPSAGSIDPGTGALAVTGLAASALGTVTVSTSRTGYVDGSANVTGQALDTQTITWAPTNTELTMPGATIRPSSGAAAAGSITYSVHAAGSTGCTLTSGTSPATWPIDINYSTPGTCTVRAAAAATGTVAAAATDVDFVVSPAPQSITASATSTRLRPGQTATISHSGSNGIGAINWTNTTPATCTLTGTTLSADANGSCVLTVSIAADATYAAATDSITITVFTPGSSGGGSGGGSGGSSGGGSSGSGEGSSSTASSGTAGNGSSGGAGSSGAAGGTTQSQDDVAVPGTGSTTRGRALPPPPTEVDVEPLRSGARSSVLIKQPVGAAGAQVLATVVVIRNANGKVISRINIELEPGQTQTRVTVPYVADGYTVDVYNVNEVGVSTGALTRSPLVRATTITKRTTSGQPRLFGQMLGKPIIFNGGSAVLDKRDKKQLRAIARQAKASNERLFVTGFARKGGGSASELASLSTKRARAAATYLSKRGVRVWIRYWGAGSLNGTGQASDRRVEVRTSAAPIPRSLVP